MSEQKPVSEMSLVEILDKNVDQQQLAKDLGKKFLEPKIAQLKADILSGKIDPIKGTSIDNSVLLAIVDRLEKLLMEAQ